MNRRKAESLGYFGNAFRAIADKPSCLFDFQCVNVGDYGCAEFAFEGFAKGCFVSSEKEGELLERDTLTEVFGKIIVYFVDFGISSDKAVALTFHFPISYHIYQKALKL